MLTAGSAMKRRPLNTGNSTSDKVGVPGIRTLSCSHSLMRDGEVEILAEGRPCAKYAVMAFLQERFAENLDLQLSSRRRCRCGRRVVEG